MMAKFKIGDRVRFVEPYARLEAGAEGTVTGFWGGGVDVNVNGVDHGCFYSRVELIPSLTITIGNHYRTRSGKPTGRVTVGDTGFEAVVDGKVRIFDKAGGAVYSDDDIVEAWVPKVGERVRMTRKVDGHMSDCAATIIHDDGSARRSLVIKFDREHSWAHSGERRAPDYHAYWVDASDLEPLPVARQPTTNVGAQVDTLAEEYGPATRATASNDNAPEPKFKVGDRVVLRNYSGSEHCYGTVEDVSVDGKCVLASDWSIGAEVGYLPVADLELADTEPDTTLHIKFTSDFSELDAAILVRKKKLKKLIKLARKAGIDLREAA